jgi:hypothetical protein
MRVDGMTVSTVRQAPDEFSGDACVVLPPNYMQSADAASELYEEELTRIVSNLDVDGLRPPLFRHPGLQVLLTAIVWLGSSAFLVCH